MPSTKKAPTEKTLLDIRCPFQVNSKKGFIYKCNRLCVRVYPGSSGETWCGMCKKNFNFEVADDNSFKSFIKVQKSNPSKINIINTREAKQKVELTTKK